MNDLLGTIQKIKIDAENSLKLSGTEKSKELSYNLWIASESAEKLLLLNDTVLSAEIDLIDDQLELLKIGYIKATSHNGDIFKLHEAFIEMTETLDTIFQQLGGSRESQ